MFNHINDFNYFEERLSSLRSLVQTDVNRFLKEDLRGLYAFFRRSKGDKDGLVDELLQLCASSFRPLADRQMLVDEWCTHLFLEVGLGGANSCRILLQMAFADLERSDFWRQIAERFQLEEHQILEMAEAEQLFDWLILWMFHNYPNLLLFLLKEDFLKPYRALTQIDLAQLVQYLPHFMFWGIRPLLHRKQHRHLVQKLAEGRNIRQIKSSPIVFSKRMAHWFVLAPRESDLVAATWFAIFKGLDADVSLIPAFKNHFNDQFQDLDFLQPIIHFFDRCSHRLGIEEMSRLLGYLQHLRDENETLNIKGWTLASLCRRARQWYDELELIRQANAAKMSTRQWAAAPYDSYEEEGKDCIFRIEQLTSARELLKEGRRMRHCVGTYAIKCWRGEASIWSLRKIDLLSCQPLVTIEVSRQGVIVQARGKQNAAPDSHATALIRRWARQAGLLYR
ncbi:MAG: PcfJ domain-containing protein [Bacteroidota bacterium]